MIIVIIYRILTHVKHLAECFPSITVSDELNDTGTVNRYDYNETLSSKGKVMLNNIKIAQLIN